MKPGILQLIEEVFQMHSHQMITFPISHSRPLQTAFAACERTFRKLRDAWIVARQERVVSRLSLHLRYDVGDIDYRSPLPQPLEEMLKSHQQTLETMWLRQFR